MPPAARVAQVWLCRLFLGVQEPTWSYGATVSRQEVDLIPLHHAIGVEASILFSQLRPYREDLRLLRGK